MDSEIEIQKAGSVLRTGIVRIWSDRPDVLSSLSIRTMPFTQKVFVPNERSRYPDSEFILPSPLPGMVAASGFLQRLSFLTVAVTVTDFHRIP